MQNNASKKGSSRDHLNGNYIQFYPVPNAT